MHIDKLKSFVGTPLKSWLPMQKDERKSEDKISDTAPKRSISVEGEPSLSGPNLDSSSSVVFPSSDHLSDETVRLDRVEQPKNFVRSLPGTELTDEVDSSLGKRSRDESSFETYLVDP